MVAKFGKTSTYVSTNRLNKCTKTNVHFEYSKEVALSTASKPAINQARGQDGWILAEFSFCVFMDRDEVEVHKNAKRERGQYPATLTELAWSIKDLLYGIKSTEKIIFVLVYFRALKRKPVICKSDSAFSSSTPTEKSQKIFLLSMKIFCERKLS